MSVSMKHSLVIIHTSIDRVIPNFERFPPGSENLDAHFDLNAPYKPLPPLSTPGSLSLSFPFKYFNFLSSFVFFCFLLLVFSFLKLFLCPKLVTFRQFAL